MHIEADKFKRVTKVKKDDLVNIISESLKGASKTAMGGSISVKSISKQITVNRKKSLVEVHIGDMVSVDYLVNIATSLEIRSEDIIIKTSRPDLLSGFVELEIDCEVIE